MADIISGTEMRAAILDELRQEVEAIREKHGTVPGLVTILVGENPASISYVTLKVKTALSLGFHEIQDNQPADVSEEALLALIDKYNRDPSIHGILVQLPLPKHIDENKVIYAIDPDKDVDGFHPVNLGRMVIGGDAVRFLPCTPAGIQEMLVRSGVEMAGAEVVVVGRSNIVGKPISVMLGQKGPGANATVTMVHTRTKDLAEHCRRADILELANFFLARLNKEFQRATVLSPEVKHCFASYQWPGNIRELRNVVEYFLYTGHDPITMEDLPPTVFHRAPQAPIRHLPETPQQPSSDVFRFVLEQLYQASEARQPIGRERLLQLARDAFVPTSQQEIRSILAQMADQGLVRVSRGRGGSQLTPEGRQLYETGRI